MLGNRLDNTSKGVLIYFITKRSGLFLILLNGLVL
jgi:hypothetical protein